MSVGGSYRDAALAIVIRMAAWDANCPQHIPVKVGAGDVAAALATRDRRIAELEAQVRQLESVVHGARSR